MLNSRPLSERTKPPGRIPFQPRDIWFPSKIVTRDDAECSYVTMMFVTHCFQPRTNHRSIVPFLFSYVFFPHTANNAYFALNASTTSHCKNLRSVRAILSRFSPKLLIIVKFVSRLPFKIDPIAKTWVRWIRFSFVLLRFCFRAKLAIASTRISGIRHGDTTSFRVTSTN